MAGRPKYDRGDYKRNLNLKVRYKITLEEFNVIAKKQLGKCAICSVKPDQLVVDHCHTNNEIRGLICKKCNTAIGNLGDTAKGVRKALAYLESYERL